MTDQEIEKLKSLCEKEGFEITVESETQGMFHINKKDIWKGVEFVECLESIYGYTKGDIYPCTGISNEVGLDYLDTSYDDYGSHSNGLCKRYAKPSTETAYVEQLKAKAKELYGEIKDGDMFDISMLEEDPQEFRMFYDNPIFTYYKKDDSLWAGNYPLYKQSKWAKKIERVRVEFTWSEGVKEDYRFHFKVSTNDNLHHAGHHLSKCLEDYLNKS